MNTVIREGCGTFLGLKLHVINGEQPCSECLRGEDLRRAEHEGIPFRLPSPAACAPVTPEQAQRNRAVLEDALRDAARRTASAGRGGRP